MELPGELGIRRSRIHRDRRIRRIDGENPGQSRQRNEVVISIRYPAEGMAAAKSPYSTAVLDSPTKTGNRFGSERTCRFEDHVSGPVCRRKSMTPHVRRSGDPTGRLRE